MGQEEWASLQHALQLLVTQFLRDELSVFVLLNFVTSMYALGAFCTKARLLPSANLLTVLPACLAVYLIRMHVVHGPCARCLRAVFDPESPQAAPVRCT